MKFDALKFVRNIDFERLAGSDGEKRACDLIVEHLRGAGLSPDVEEFGINTFDTGSATLTVDGRSFDIHPYGLESERTIKGEIAVLENADVLYYNHGAYEGKIVSCGSFCSPVRNWDCGEALHM